MSSKNRIPKLVAVSRANAATRILDAALRLLTENGGPEVTMAQVAKSAGISRQAVYLHYADRAALFLALARYVDEKRNLAGAQLRVTGAPSGVAALGELAELQARMNPGVWAVARAVDAIRRSDEAAEQAWQDRLASRLSQCRAIVGRLRKEQSLRSGLSPQAATDLLWTVTSLRTWEDLVLQRGWTPQQYATRITALLVRALTNTDTQ